MKNHWLAKASADREGEGGGLGLGDGGDGERLLASASGSLRGVLAREGIAAGNGDSTLGGRWTAY